MTNAELRLDPSVIARLESISQTDPSESRKKRARIVLLYGQGRASAEIAREVGLSVSRVRHWKREFARNKMGIFGGRDAASPRQKTATSATPGPAPVTPTTPAPGPVTPTTPAPGPATATTPAPAPAPATKASPAQKTAQPVEKTMKSVKKRVKSATKQVKSARKKVKAAQI